LSAHEGLFGQTDQPGQRAKASPLNRQMLDLVLDGAKDLRRKLTQDDPHKLDEYLDSVRAVERRITARTPKAIKATCSPRS